MAHPLLLAIILTIRTQEVVLHCPVRGDFLECHDEDDFMADDTSLGNEDGALYVLSGSEPSVRCMVWIMLWWVARIGGYYRRGCVVSELRGDY